MLGWNSCAHVNPRLYTLNQSELCFPALNVVTVQQHKTEELSVSPISFHSLMSSPQYGADICCLIEP